MASTFTLGREIISSILKLEALDEYLNEGWNLSWIDNQEDLGHVVVFKETDAAAYRFILKHYAKHGKVPAESLFRLEFPEATYNLPRVRSVPSELIEIAREDLKQYEIESAQVDVEEMLDAGATPEDIAERFMEAATRIRQRRAMAGVVRDFNSEDEDIAVNKRMDEEIPFGIGLGLDGFDEQEGWNGIQPGQMLVFLGRAKAGKTSFAINTALQAYLLGNSVLFLTFEISAQGILDRLHSMGAKVDATKFRTGRLDSREKQKVRDFREDMSNIEADFRIIEPTGRYTLDDLEEEVAKFDPDLVVIDGFYFMYDRTSGKSGSHWEGHDNLSGELKGVTLSNKISTIVTHQVREKQIAGKKGKGIDDGTMMGGTGLIMAADAVFGIDIDPETQENILTQTRGREGYLSSIKGVWDWEKSTFNEVEWYEDEDAEE